jgi:hypothetical protein
LYRVITAYEIWRDQNVFPERPGMRRSDATQSTPAAAFDDRSVAVECFETPALF